MEKYFDKPIPIRVKTYDGQPLSKCEIIERIPQEMSGWQKVRYKNKFYQLFGGIRTDYFICTYTYLKTRSRR